MTYTNVLDFAKNALGVTLYPLQETLLKIIFGVPLDYQPQTITVWDDLREKKLYVLSEPDYLKMCFEEQKCNYGDWQDLPATGFNEAHLFQGRRSGKDLLLAVAASYKLYDVLRITNPQAHFNLRNGSPIDITVFGHDEYSAERMNGLINSCLEYSGVFDAHSKGKGRFITEADRLSRSPHPSVALNTFPATTRASRGPTNIGLFFNEFTFYKNSEEVYASSVPSTMNFRTDTENAALILSASSPWYTSGKAFRLHEQAFSTLKPYIFTHNETTATLNPFSLPQFLTQAKAKNPHVFDSEYGGKFVHKNESVTLKYYLENGLGS